MSTSESASSCFLIGRSVEQRAIAVWADNDDGTRPVGPGSTLLIGGLHGDEFATITLLELFFERVRGAGLFRSPVAVIPLANPDGFQRQSRYNAHSVDLNRNCGFNWRIDSAEPAGPEPWSEPESRALRDFIWSWQPDKIVSLHWALAEIDADGVQSTPLADAMWQAMSEEERKPYRIRVSQLGRGQRRLEQTYVECPGSFGQWCGYALEYPDGRIPSMITLELPYDPNLPRPVEELPTDHLRIMHDYWKRDSEQYLREVEPAVFKMLLAACRFPTENPGSTKGAPPQMTGG